MNGLILGNRESFNLAVECNLSWHDDVAAIASSATKELRFIFAGTHSMFLQYGSTQCCSEQGTHWSSSTFFKTTFPSSSSSSQYRNIHGFCSIIPSLAHHGKSTRGFAVCIHTKASRLWKQLPADVFSSSPNRQMFKSRVNRHLAWRLVHYVINK